MTGYFSRPPTLTDHAEFARCPQPLPMGSPSLPISSCELNKNTRRCHQQPLATHLSCRLYQTCDHAVLISGTTGFTSKLQESCFWQRSDILTSHDATFSFFFWNILNTAGGWQQQITFQHHVQSLQKFYRMLQNNGFPKDHIKTFFSNGQLSGMMVSIYESQSPKIRT